MKKVINEQICIAHKTSTHYNNQFTWGEVKQFLLDADIELQDTDTLDVYHEEGFCYVYSPADASYNVVVTRSRQETDEEYERRVSSQKRASERNKEERRKTYETLKKEFENE